MKNKKQMDSCIYFFVDKKTPTISTKQHGPVSIFLTFHSCVSITFSSQASIEMTENLKFWKSRVKSTKTTKHFHSMRAGGLHGGLKDVSGEDPVNVSNILLGVGFQTRSQSLNCQTGSIYIFKEI